MNLQETIGLVHLLHQSPYTSKTFQKASRAGSGLSYWPHFSMACRELPAQSVFSGSMFTESKILKERRGGGGFWKVRKAVLGFAARQAQSRVLSSKCGRVLPECSFTDPQAPSLPASPPPCCIQTECTQTSISAVSIP